MHVKIIDHSGNPIDPTQLPQLNLWNSIAEHICASTLQRLHRLEDGSPAYPLQAKEPL